MIKKIAFILPFVAALVLSSCKDKDETKKVFGIYPQELEFESSGDSSIGGDSVLFSVYADNNEDWTITIGDQDPSETQASFNTKFTQFFVERKGRLEDIIIYSKPNESRVKHVDSMIVVDKTGIFGTKTVKYTILPIEITFEAEDSVFHLPSEGEFKLNLKSNIDEYKVLKFPEWIKEPNLDTDFVRNEDGGLGGVLTLKITEKNTEFIKIDSLVIVGSWPKEKDELYLKLELIQDPKSDIDSDKAILSKLGWSDYAEISKVTTSAGDVDRVTALNLQNKNLTGVLSAEIANLSYLRVLRINGNKFTGEFPMYIDKLPLLNTLILNDKDFGNKFTGDISTIAFANMIEMREFMISGLGVTGTISAGFSMMEGLHTLRLDNNNLTGELPASISELDKLKIFTVNGNQLTGKVPASYQSNLNLNWTAWNAKVNILPQQNGVMLEL